MKIYLNLNCGEKLFEWFYKIYAYTNKYEIIIGKHELDISEHKYKLNHIPTFTFSPNKYEIIDSHVLTLDNMSKYLSGSYLIVFKKRDKIPLVLDYLSRWSRINELRMSIFVGYSYFRDIIKFDGRRKELGYDIATINNVPIPTIYFINQYIKNIVAEINKLKLNNFVIKPNCLDTGAKVYIHLGKNRINDKEIYDFFEHWKKLINGKELMVLMQSNDAKLILEEYIPDAVCYKFYIFGGKIEYIMLVDDKNSKKMHNANFEAFDMDLFKQGVERVGKSLSRKPQYFASMAEDALRLYSYYNNYYNGHPLAYFLRVDFLGNFRRYYFNEFCLFPNGGKGRNIGEKIDYLWGEKFLGIKKYIET